MPGDGVYWDERYRTVGSANTSWYQHRSHLSQGALDEAGGRREEREVELIQPVVREWAPTSRSPGLSLPGRDDAGASSEWRGSHGFGHYPADTYCLPSNKATRGGAAR